MRRLIKEIAGIAKATIPYTNAVKDRIPKHLKHFFENVYDEEYLETVSAFRRDGYLPSPDYAQELKLPYRYLAPYITDEDFKDFPVVQINMDLSFRYVEKTSDSPFFVEGGAYPIFVSRLNQDSMYGYRVKPELFPVSKKRASSVNRAVVASIDFDIMIFENFDPERDYKNLEKEIYSVIFHEMMHVYEAYKNRGLDVYAMKPGTTKPRSKAETAKSYLSNSKMIGVPNEIKKELANFLHLYYVSLPTEIQAITQEIYPQISDVELKDFFTDTYQGRMIKALQKFDKNEFYSNLKNEAIKYFERTGQEPDQMKIETFFESVRRNLISKYIKTSNENHQVIDKKFINKKTLKDLIDYMSVQIKNASDRLIKNVGRLYSIKNEPSVDRIRKF